MQNNFKLNTSTEIVQDHPAVAYVKPIRMEVTEGMIIALPFETRRYGTMYREFTVGSIFGYAVKNNSCPMEALERAAEHGHSVYFIYANATIIDNMHHDKKVVPAFNWGDEVKFLGKRFTIEKAPNDNAILKIVDQEVSR